MSKSWQGESNLGYDLRIRQLDDLEDSSWDINRVKIEYIKEQYGGDISYIEECW